MLCSWNAASNGLAVVENKLNIVASAHSVGTCEIQKMCSSSDGGLLNRSATSEPKVVQATVDQPVEFIVHTSSKGLFDVIYEGSVEKQVEMPDP